VSQGIPGGEGLSDRAAVEQDPASADMALRAAVFDLEPGGIALLGENGFVVLIANRSFRRALPDPELDPVGRTLEEIWPTEAGLELRATLERVLQVGEPVRFERLEHPGPDGSTRRFAYHVQRLPLGDPALLLVLWETTVLEDARQMAERSRERAELLASMASDLNADVGLDAVLRTAVLRAAALLGAEDGSVWLLDRREVHLRAVAEILPRARAGLDLSLAEVPFAALAMQQRAARLFRRGEAKRHEAEWMAAHGVAAGLVVPLVEGGRACGVLYLHYESDRFLPNHRDVAFADALAGQCAIAIGRARIYEAERSERARAEAAEREARGAEHLQERLAAMVGRDLRASLRAIHLGLSVLARREGLQDVERRTLHRMASSAGRIDRIIDDLLDFARVRSGAALPLSRELVQLGELARAVIGDLEVVHEREVELSVEAETYLEADRSRLERLVANLVGYALGVGEPGGRVRVSVGCGGDEVTLAVEVEGLALAPSAIPILFEPLRAAGDATRGGGLGLFSVREIARAHGGEVHVERGPDGARFEVTLPGAQAG
jgi:signal transduction histidine kinase